MDRYVAENVICFFFQMCAFNENIFKNEETDPMLKQKEFNI